MHELKEYSSFARRTVANVPIVGVLNFTYRSKIGVKCRHMVNLRLLYHDPIIIKMINENYKIP